MSESGPVVAAAALVAVVVAAGAVVVGVVPFGGDVGGVDDAPGTTATRTQTPVDTGTVYDSSESGATSGSSAPFSLRIRSVEECGDTCRDVTAELSNDRDVDATGVAVYTRVYAGNSTDGDDEVWEGTERVGRLDADESVAVTRRVEVSYADAIEIRNGDGWVTILTTVDADDATVTFTRRRDVD